MRRTHWSIVVFEALRRHLQQRILFSVLCALLVGVTFPAHLLAQDADFVSDRNGGIALQHTQAWGDFGFDTAAAAAGNTGSPMRIGEKTFDKGLGHHANGEIVIDLRGQYSRFRTWVGVQWQGG